MYFDVYFCFDRCHKILLKMESYISRSWDFCYRYVLLGKSALNRLLFIMNYELILLVTSLKLHPHVDHNCYKYYNKELQGKGFSRSKLLLLRGRFWGIYLQAEISCLSLLFLCFLALPTKTLSSSILWLESNFLFNNLSVCSLSKHWRFHRRN